MPEDFFDNMPIDIRPDLPEIVNTVFNGGQPSPTVVNPSLSPKDIASIGRIAETIRQEYDLSVRSAVEAAVNVHCNFNH